MPRSRFLPYRSDIVPFLRLRDLLAVPVPSDAPADDRALPLTYTRIPLPPQRKQFTIRGIPVRLEAQPHGLFLIIGDSIVYSIIAQNMPRHRWHHQPRHNQYWEWTIDNRTIQTRPLQPGDPASRFPLPPVRYLIRDSLGHNTRQLFLHVPTGIIGSEYELRAQSIYIHSSYHLTPAQRHQRNLDRLFARFPERRDDVMNLQNDIAKLMTQSHRPYDTRDRTWMRLILAARFSLSGEKLETETTAAIEQWRASKKSRGNPKGKLPWYGHRSLAAINKMRTFVLERENELIEPPPLPREDYDF
jgi:hypothetical protein